MESPWKANKKLHRCYHTASNSTFKGTQSKCVDQAFNLA